MLDASGVVALKHKEGETLKGFFRCLFINGIMGVIISQVEKGLQLKWTV